MGGTAISGLLLGLALLAPGGASAGGQCREPRELLQTGRAIRAALRCHELKLLGGSRRACTTPPVPACGRGALAGITELVYGAAPRSSHWGRRHGARELRCQRAVSDATRTYSPGGFGAGRPACAAPRCATSSGAWRPAAGTLRWSGCPGVACPPSPRPALRFWRRGGPTPASSRAACPPASRRCWTTRAPPSSRPTSC